MMYLNILFIREYNLTIHIRYSPCLYSNSDEYIFQDNFISWKSVLLASIGPCHGQNYWNS